jgi:hypothetical protein
MRTENFENNNDNTIEVHSDHPYVANLDAFKSAYQSITGQSSTGSYIAEGTQIFRQSKLSNLSSDTFLGKKQNMYIYDASASKPTLMKDYTNDITTVSSIVFDRTLKCSFEENDKYLLGKNSCGSYLFIAANSHESIIVDGKSSVSTKKIEFGGDNALLVPIVYQFRMTDYWGTDNQGLGNIGGIKNGSITNLSYAKRIGIDIYDNNENIFAFDIEVFAKYKADGLTLNNIPSRQVQVAIDDLRKTIKNLSPSLIETNIDATKK